MDKKKRKKDEATFAMRVPSGVLAIALAPNEKSVLAGSLNGVYVASLESDEHEKLFEHDSYVSSVEWLDDSTIISASYDGTACWYNVAKRQMIRRIRLHEFWSWDMAVSGDRSLLASVTGQYLAGGYRYEPQAESEPSLKIVRTDTGEIIHELSHVPSVQAVAFSHDNRYVAAGNLMGEVRVYDVATGATISTWTTSDFTSWGIIKSHCYLGGIFAIDFAPGDDEVLIAGMGPMADPMAANGKQRWQKWSWREQPELVVKSDDATSGEGLMETIAINPAGATMSVAGRLRKGDWNLATFEIETGKMLQSFKTHCRVTDSTFFADGKRMLVGGMVSQPEKKNEEGQWPHFGRIKIYQA